MKLIGNLSLPSVTLKRALIGLIPLVVLGTFYWSSGARSNGQVLVTVEARRGPFTAKLSEAGELRALILPQFPRRKICSSSTSRPKAHS